MRQLVLELCSSKDRVSLSVSASLTSCGYHRLFAAQADTVS